MVVLMEVDMESFEDVEGFAVGVGVSFALSGDDSCLLATGLIYVVRVLVT
jgi:hypothetical protein